MTRLTNYTLTIEENTQLKNNTKNQETPYDLVVLPDKEKDLAVPSTTIHPMRPITRSLTGAVVLQYRDTFIGRAHQLFVSALTKIGYQITAPKEDEPDLSRLIATAAISHDEHTRQHPKWSKAKCGSDREQ